MNSPGCVPGHAHGQPPGGGGRKSVSSRDFLSNIHQPQTYSKWFFVQIRPLHTANAHPSESTVGGKEVGEGRTIVPPTILNTVQSSAVLHRTTRWFGSPTSAPETKDSWRLTVRAPQRAGWVAGAKGSAAPRAPVGRETLPGHVGLPASSAPATPGLPHSRTICWEPGKDFLCTAVPRIGRHINLNLPTIAARTVGLHETLPHPHDTRKRVYFGYFVNLGGIFRSKMSGSRINMENREFLLPLSVGRYMPTVSPRPSRTKWQAPTKASTSPTSLIGNSEIRNPLENKGSSFPNREQPPDSSAAPGAPARTTVQPRCAFGPGGRSDPPNVQLYDSKVHLPQSRADR